MQKISGNPMSMTPERWKQIEELYQAAMDCGAEERAALLAKASLEVRGVVGKMLEQDTVGNILDRPAWEIETEAQSPSRPDRSRLDPRSLPDRSRRWQRRHG